MIAAARVTIIVLNWNRRDETLVCLDSLERAALEGAAILVVDNGSRDGSVEAIREQYPAVRIVALPENQGYAGGNNAGIRAALEAGAEAVLLLNNDTFVAPDFLWHLLGLLNSDEQIAAVSSAVLRADSPEVLDCAYLELYWGHGIVHRVGMNALPGEGYDVVKPVDVAVGCSLLIRAAALRDVGLFDETYFAYHEEVDWCYRAHQKGYLIYFQPYSRVWHHGSRSTDALVKRRPRPRALDDRPQLPNPIALSWNPVRTYLGARNTVRFVQHHGSREQKRFFLRSSLYQVPLAFLAALMEREEEIMMGIWTYRRAVAVYFFPRHGEAGRRLAGHLLRLPVRLFWTFPADVWRAHRAGRTAQVRELVRGLWDWYRGRPLPLERLGLR